MFKKFFRAYKGPAENIVNDMMMTSMIAAGVWLAIATYRVVAKRRKK